MRWDLDLNPAVCSLRRMILNGFRYRVAAPSIRIVPWAALASCWPLPQQLLPVSATGGGRRRCALAYSAEFLFYFAFGATAFAERSVAMEAPVGLLSGRAVCVSRWRGFAPTSSAERSKRIFTSGVVKLNCICHTAFSLVNLFYQYFRFYNSSVLYYNKVATLLLKSTGGCFLDS